MRKRIYRPYHKPKPSINVTLLIVAINLIFFLVLLSLAYYDEEMVYSFALQPASAFQRPWTFLTSMFSHVILAHLFVNMVSLFFVGSFLEKLIGKKRYIIFYLVSGLVAGLLFVLLAFAFNKDINAYAVGASGALFGLAGLLAVLTPKLPVLVFFVIPMPMWLAMIFLLFGLWLISWLAGLPIGNTAHLGGAITGLVYGFWLRHKYRKKVAILDRHFR